ncbi:MAG TPA: DUF2569 family protein [Allosphingosinicella sp.]|nr:DUF2569 family protein [Allosphingosinicella sp.]
MAYTDPGGDGVGGWLSVFVVMLGIYSAQSVLGTLVELYGNGDMAMILGDRWAAAQLVQWGLLILLVGSSAYVIWRLFARQTWKTVRITIAMIWAVGVGYVALGVLGASLVTGAPIWYLLQNVDFRVYLPVVFAIVWTPYFLTSTRVAMTYPRRPDDEEAVQVFQ